MPPKLRPFTSFLNQGMQNTNQNINNTNQPQFNSPFGNPYNPPGATGFGTGRTGAGGGVMSSDPLFWWEAGMHGGGSDAGAGEGQGEGFGQYTPGFGQEPTDIVKDQYGQGFITETQQFSSEDYYNVFNQLPPDLQSHITQQGGMYSIDDPNSLISQIMSQFWSSSSYGPEGSLGWDMAGLQDWIESYMSGQTNYLNPPGGESAIGIDDMADWKDDFNIGQQDIGEMPTEELPPGWTWQFINGNWEPVNVGAGEGQQGEQDFVGETDFTITPGDTGGTGGTGMAGDHPGFNVGTDYQGGDYFQTGESKTGSSWDVYNDNVIDMLDYQFAQSQGAEQGFLDNLMGHLQGGISQGAGQFTGGGGVGGQRAKKLYYAPTQGGFASVGEGMRRQQGQPSLEDLLKKLQG